MLNVIEKLRQFDAYPKTAEDFRIKTFSGATITIISSVIIISLFISELQSYLSPNIEEELFVDTSRGSKLKINIDIVVPTISCDYLAIDAMDSSGEQHLQIDHSIYKRRLSLEGEPIEEPKKEDIVSSKEVLEEKPVNKTEVECGSCYGASDKCCNTCEDVKEAYRLKQWAMESLENYAQCKNEIENEKSRSAFKEGCQIYGYMEVNRVGGSFHIAPGRSFTINHVHVHDVQPYSASAFNTTHIIKHLSFGPSILGDISNPLDGAMSVATEGATMFQYFFKIIPTMYIKLDKSVVNTNQFSVTKHQKTVLTLSGESGMPGAFFSYELSPLMVKYTEKERSLGHFATNMCAIIGGVVTAAAIIDTVLYHSTRAVQKLQLEKGN